MAAPGLRLRHVGPDIRYLAATDGRDTNEILLDYLEPRLRPADTVHVVQLSKGATKDAGIGEDENEVVLESDEILTTMEDRLTEHADVATHQPIRGNDSDEDILAAAADYVADEIVVGIRQRSASERVPFGSTAQSVLMNTDRPVTAVPLARS